MSSIVRAAYGLSSAARQGDFSAQGALEPRVHHDERGSRRRRRADGCVLGGRLQRCQQGGVHADHDARARIEHWRTGRQAMRIQVMRIVCHTGDVFTSLADLAPIHRPGGLVLERVGINFPAEPDYRDRCRSAAELAER
jgi:hypothetical protein